MLATSTFTVGLFDSSIPSACAICSKSAFLRLRLMGPSRLIAIDVERVGKKEEYSRKNAVYIFFSDSVVCAPSSVPHWPKPRPQLDVTGVQ